MATVCLIKALIEGKFDGYKLSVGLFVGSILGSTDRVVEGIKEKLCIGPMLVCNKRSI